MHNRLFARSRVFALVFILASVFCPVTLTTAQAASATTTTITSLLNPSEAGDAVTFPARVATMVGGVPTGTVTFKAGGSTIGGVAVQPESVASTFAAGLFSSCVLFANGTVACSGHGGAGVLGNGSTEQHLVPTSAGGLTGVTDITSGDSAFVCVLSGGSVLCWGNNGSGQLGRVTSNTFDANRGAVENLGNNVIAVRAGGTHACALLSSGGGTVKCWGWNLEGQLGNGVGSAATPVVDVVGLTNVRDIALGGDHSCALLKSGSVKCWGHNEEGQIGTGAAGADISTPVDVVGLTGVRAITGGEDHTCALLNSGGIKCWGSNNRGQLGNNGIANSPTPVDVIDPGVTYRGVVAGNVSTCGVTNAGTVKCWGRNGNGELSDFTTTDRHLPVNVLDAPAPGGNPVTGFANVARGFFFYCGVMIDGTVKCWGRNSNGAFGNNNINSTSPIVTAYGSDPGEVLAYGEASVSTSALSVGSHAMTAEYGGDVAHTASTSVALTQIVEDSALPESTTSLGSSASTTVFGQEVTFSALVTSTAGTPTGTVTFKDGGATIGTGSLSGGVASLKISSLTVGGHTITAVYAGDSNIAGSTSNDRAHTVNKGQTTIAILANPNPSHPGAPVSFTITVSPVSPASGTPDGTINVTFGDGVGDESGVDLTGGSVIIDHTYAAAGTFAPAASYNGSASFATSSTTTSQTVNKHSTTTTLAVPGSSVFGQEVTFTATVASSTGTPTGAVTFKDGGTTLGTGNLSGDTATFKTSSLAVGAHSITAEYADSAAFLGSASTAQAHAVNKIAPTTTLGALPVTPKPGQAVTLTAIVGVVSPATGTPTGNVVFKKGPEALGTKPLVAGQAKLTISTLAISNNAITANYVGGTSYAASTGTTTVVIDPKVGTEFRVNTRTPDAQQFPSVSRCGVGYVAVWASRNQDGSDYGVYGQRLTVDGLRLGGEFRVNTRTAGIQSSPAVACLSDSFVVVWESQGQDGGGYGIYAQRYTKAGDTVGREFRVNTTTVKDQHSPAVAPLGSGFAVAWTSLGQDGSGAGVYAQRFDKAGDPLGVEFKVNSFTTKDQRSPQLIRLKGGTLVAIWESDGQDGSGLGIYARRYNAAGTALGPEFKVNKVTAKAQSLPAITPLSNGGFAAAWQSAGQDGSGLGIYMQRFSANGAKVGPETLVNTIKLNNQGAPAIGGFADRGFMVAWTSRDGTDTGIFAQAFNGNGKPANLEFRLNTTHINVQSQPALATGTSGNFLAAWTSFGQDSSREGVFGQNFKFFGLKP